MLVALITQFTMQIFERLQLIAGNPGIAKARPLSRWVSRKADYIQHLPLMPSTEEWIKK